MPDQLTIHRRTDKYKDVFAVAERLTTTFGSATCAMVFMVRQSQTFKDTKAELDVEAEEAAKTEPKV